LGGVRVERSGEARAGLLSPSRLRQHLAALTFLYRKTLGVPQAVSFFAWPNDPEPLPVVLSLAEVARLLAAMPMPAYRMLFCTMYASGLAAGSPCRRPCRRPWKVPGTGEWLRFLHGRHPALAAPRQGSTPDFTRPAFPNPEVRPAWPARKPQH